MPETDTLPTDRTPDRDAPQAPQGPPQGSFQNLSEQLYGTTEAWKRSAAKVREGLERKSEATEPLIAAAEKELTAPRPTPPAPPSLPAPPSRQLTEFLAPVEGESPSTSITKLLQAVGLFATGISGAARGDARAGLAAFTGAMKGWQEGDIIRADRHFADWEAKTATALTKWKTERQTYQDIMEAGTLSLDQKMKLLHLAALREGNKLAASEFEMGELDKVIGFLSKQQGFAGEMERWKGSLAQAKELADEHRKLEKERIAIAREEGRMRQAEINLRREEALDQPAHGRYYDSEGGDVRTISKRELMQDVSAAAGGGKPRFREMKPAEAQLIERVAIGFPILDRLDKLMDKIQVAAKGENITQGLINRLKAKSGISEDLKEFATLKLDQALEQAAAMSGGMPRIAILKMLRGEASPGEHETIGVGKRAIETTRTTLKNRITQSTGDPEAWKKLSDKLEQYVPKTAPANDGWKIEAVK